MNKKLRDRRCGTCAFFSYWTGECTYCGRFEEVNMDGKPCEHWKLAPDYFPEDTDSMD